MKNAPLFQSVAPFSLGLLLCSTVLAQDHNAALTRMLDSQQQTTKALIRSARNLTDAAAREVESSRSWEEVRGKRVNEMLDMLGLWPVPERTPLRTRIVGKLDRGDYVVEKLAFESLPRIYVSANLYLPLQGTGPFPAVIYVCGHAYSRFGSKTKYQRHGISLAKGGYVALILDPIQIAETFALHHGVQGQGMYEWYARGYTPAGIEVWNAIRAIDYLETRPEVDSERIGMTGRSGGAAMTWFTTCVDPRVKVAVPVMGISTYAANVREDTQSLHCDCMFVINSYRHGMLHQGALIAPRPLLMAHGSQDRLFPVAGYEEFEERIGKLYESYGRPSHFRNIVVETGHEDSDYLRGEAIGWFDRYLKEIPARELDLTYENEPEEVLAVFPDGPPADAQNYRVHEDFVRTPEFKSFNSLTEWEDRRRELVSLLKQSVFGGFPVSDRPPTLIHRVGSDGYFDQLAFESEPGVGLRALLHQPERANGSAVLYIASKGEDQRSIQQLFSQARNPDSVVRMVLYPRGIGEIGWNKSFWKRTLRNAMHVGYTVDSLRLWDVLSSIRLLQSVKGVDRERITVMGAGTSGILGLYAAILNPQVYQVLLIRPPSTHLDGPLFLNILRYMDLPEAAAILAPRRLNFYGTPPVDFAPVRSIYALWSASDKFHVSMDVEAVVQGRYDHHFASGR